MTRLHSIEAHCSAPTCRAPIWWLTNTTTGKKAPIDPTPTDAGNCLVDLDAETWQVVRADAIADYAGLGKLHTNHFGTCPARAQFGAQAVTTLPAPPPPTLRLQKVQNFPHVTIWYGGIHLGQFESEAKAKQFKAMFKLQTLREIVAAFGAAGIAGDTPAGQVLARLLAALEAEMRP